MKAFILALFLGTSFYASAQTQECLTDQDCYPFVCSHGYCVHPPSAPASELQTHIDGLSNLTCTLRSCTQCDSIYPYCRQSRGFDECCRLEESK